MEWWHSVKSALATSFGLGHVPPGPGTVGTAPAVAAYVLVACFAPESLHGAVLAVLLLAACAGTVWLGPWAEQRWGNKDPGAFVLDEVAGFRELPVRLARGPRHPLLKHRVEPAEHRVLLAVGRDEGLLPSLEHAPCRVEELDA